MARKVFIGDKDFPSQKACLNHFKMILHLYEDGDIITRSDHSEDLRNLLYQYDQTRTAFGLPAKISGRVHRFERRLNKSLGWSTSGFWVVCEDGSEKDFSYIAAVKNKIDPDDQVFYRAARAAVALPIILAKKRAFNERAVDGKIVCEVTSEKITIDQAHIDHADPPFRTIVASYRASKGWQDEIPKSVISSTDETAFTDETVVSEFQEFHKNLATLRIISAKANLSLSHYARAPKIMHPVKID